MRNLSNKNSELLNSIVDYIDSHPGHCIHANIIRKLNNGNTIPVSVHNALMDLGYDLEIYKGNKYSRKLYRHGNFKNSEFLACYDAKLGKYIWESKEKYYPTPGEYKYSHYWYTGDNAEIIANSGIENHYRVPSKRYRSCNFDGLGFAGNKIR